MAWFKVDDGLHDHRKVRRVRRSHAEKRRDVAPFGLWVLAGSWASGNGTKGFIPSEVLEEWDDDSADLAGRLVAAGLWWETEEDGEPGYGFHDWHDYVPRVDGINDSAESGRRGNHVRWHEKRNRIDPECEFCTFGHRPESGGDVAPNRVGESGPYREPVPTRPDPSLSCASTDVERGWDEWWRTYPRKKAKAQALKAYRGALKKVDGDVLLSRLRLQIPALTARGDQYTPYPATWLNGERWADDLVAATTPRPPEARDLELPPDGLSPQEYAEWEFGQRQKRGLA